VYGRPGRRGSGSMTLHRAGVRFDERVTSIAKYRHAHYAQGAVSSYSTALGTRAFVSPVVSAVASACVKRADAISDLRESVAVSVITTARRLPRAVSS